MAGWKLKNHSANFVNDGIGIKNNYSTLNNIINCLREDADINGALATVHMDFKRRSKR